MCLIAGHEGIAPKSDCSSEGLAIGFWQRRLIEQTEW
jgi:hypothetical protein